MSNACAMLCMVQPVGISSKTVNSIIINNSGFANPLLVVPQEYTNASFLLAPGVSVL